MVLVVPHEVRGVLVSLINEKDFEAMMHSVQKPPASLCLRANSTKITVKELLKAIGE